MFEGTRGVRGYETGDETIELAARPTGNNNTSAADPATESDANENTVADTGSNEPEVDTTPLGESSASDNAAFDALLSQFKS